MTRVSTAGQQESLLRNLLNNQERVFKSQELLNSGKVSSDFKGLANKATTLMNSRSFRSRVTSFENTIEVVRGKVQSNDVQLEGMLDMARRFRQKLLEVIAADEAIAFQDVMTDTFNVMADSLNTQVGGVYIFGGSKTDTPPFTATNLTGLVAATTAQSLFVNDNRAQVARVSDNVNIDFSLLADNIAEPFMAVLKTIANYDQNTTTISGKLTPAMTTFLKTELANVDTAIDSMQVQQTRNGLKFERLETIASQHADTAVFLEGFISDLEDTNMAEVVTQLNIDQVALQASLQTMSSLSSVSLLDYL